jgi:Ca2+-binding EF-hand superfamily protein
MPYGPGKKLEQDGVIKMQKEFLECDLDGDGRITVKELEGVLRSLKKKMNVTDKEIERVIKEIDADSDGTINLNEYYDTMTNTTNKNLIYRALVSRSKIRKQFEKYDTDGSGYITWDEMKEVYEERMGRKLDVKEVKQLVKETDENDDGKINYDEFLALICK